MSIKTYVFEYHTDKNERLELITSALQEFTGNEQATVSFNGKGKAVIKGCKAHLSVACSGEVMVVVVSNKQIGIDGEYMPRIHQKKVDYYNLAERFFSEDEAEYVRGGDDTATRFVKVWVRKEAYVKYTGKGLTDFPNFSVVNDSGHFESEVGGVNIKRFNPSFPMSEDYIFAIATNEA
jgi:phosphopantetheine--protein transferase-like protein